MKVHQMRVVMDRIRRMEKTPDDNLKFPISIDVRIVGKLSPYGVTINLDEAYKSAGSIDADFDAKMFSIIRKKKCRIYIPFESITAIILQAWDTQYEKDFD